VLNNTRPVCAMSQTDVAKIVNERAVARDRKQEDNEMTKHWARRQPDC